jgi:prepilin-type N-terminal cleavage/methylation domain-containing protein
MRHLAKLQQRGDTIVEVLVAITIVSLILGGAYVTSHNSLIATRDTQEHANALQLAQIQVEWLRTLENTNSLIFTTPTPFCISSSGTPVVACTVDSTGAHNANPALNIYKVEITNRTGGGNGPYTFTTQASWPGLQNDKDQVQLIYRVYK